jgi:DNA-directed RNA polymerase specialized sigma24 family protein
MKYSQSFDQYVVDFAAAVESRVQYLRFLSEDDKEDVTQSIIEWMVKHPEKADEYPPDELAIMNVKFKAIDWKRRNAREACEAMRNKETGGFMTNKRIAQMTDAHELEMATRNTQSGMLTDVEGSVVDEMDREHLEARLKANLTDLQWTVLYKRTVEDLSNNEISEALSSPHYNISRAYKAAIINAREYLEIEMRNEDQDQNLSEVIDLEEVSRYESKLDTSNNQQFVVAS